MCSAGVNVSQFTKHELLQLLFYIDHKNLNGDTPFIDLMVKSQIMRRAVSLECPLCFSNMMLA